MKKPFFAALLAGLALSASTAAMANGRHPVKPLAGYTCMMLNLTHEQEMDFAHPVMLYAEPKEGASDMGGAGELLAVKTGTQPVNGFLPTLQMNMKPAWVKASILKPYQAKADPSARCTPVLMSDGTQGFSYSHG